MIFFCLLFIFPAIVGCVCEYVAQPFFFDGKLDIFFKVKYFLTALIIGFFPYFYFFRLFKKTGKTLIFVSFLRYLFVYLTAACVLLTLNLPNENILLAVLDTNLAEAVDFFKFLPFKFYAFSICYWGIYLFLVLKARLENDNPDRLFPACAFIAFSVIGCFAAYKNDTRPSIYETLRSYRYLLNLTKEKPIEIPLTVAPPLNVPETIVVAVGESENNAVFQKHAPYLHSLTNEEKNTVIIDDTETMATATITVLRNLFLRKSPAGPFNLLNLYNQAGYKTFWLSNLYKESLRPTKDFIYALSSAASYHRYLNKTDIDTIFTDKAISYDNVLTDGLKDALQDSSGRKIIFLHFLGSHVNRRERYPDDFHSPLVEFKKDKNYSDSEHYDNTAAYTDTVLSEIVFLLKKQKEPTAFVYFSDHGDNPDFPNQRDSDIAKKVPLMFWLSETYQTFHPEMLKNLRCLNNVRLYNLPYVWNQITGLDTPYLNAPENIRQCFN